jgi:EmrB/QacA subfamily drug resistance transporter
VLTATVLGSSLAFVDATVVSIALPAIGADLDAGLAGLAWTVNAYTLTLAALILLGGSLGDRLGRRRIFVLGVVWFACASLLCGLAPNIELLVAARALQGVGGALLTPGSLAILQSSFRPEDRARAIGAWSGLGGVAGAAGPFLGGWLVESASWRWIFLINVPLAVAIVVISSRCVPETQDPNASEHTDVVGSVLAAVGLAGLTWGLLAWPDAGLSAVEVNVPLVGGLLALVAFVAWEARAKDPMLPLGHLLVAAVQRNEPGHLCGLRRAGRRVLLAGADPAGGVRLLTAGSGHGDAAGDALAVSALSARRRTRDAHRAAAADDRGTAARSRRGRCAGPDRA